MTNQIVRLNTHALSVFNKTLALANLLQDENEHHPAAWFDTPEKRIRWWLDLEPQWRKAFNEAVFYHKRMDDVETYNPTDKELSHLFELKYLNVCGNGDFDNRNNYPNITFCLTNLAGVANLTNLTRIDCDYNGTIASLESVQHLKKLKTLWCDNNSLTDLSPLMGLPKLKSLCCWNNQIRSVEPLASILTLNDLTLGANNQGNPIVDFSPLSHLTHLKRLYIDNCQVENLGFLSNCKKLTFVDAVNNNLDRSDERNVLEDVNVWL